MYIERLILREISEQKEKGSGRKVRDFHACLGYGELINAVKSLKDSPELTRLAPDMRGIDPDDAFSRIPYEKGCLLLIYLESLVGGIDRMIGFLQSYFKKFARHSIDSSQMIGHFNEHFGGHYEVDWDTWLNGEGVGPWNPMSYLDQSMNQHAQVLAKKWQEQNGAGASPNDIKWDATVTMVFLDNLINDERKMDAAALKRLDETYQLSKNKNVEILVRYLRLALMNEFMEVMPIVRDFLSRHGRGVYLKPLYKLLINLSNRGLLSKDEVKQIYQTNRSYYHSVIRNTFDAELD